jgi:hypothetical protein
VTPQFTHEPHRVIALIDAAINFEVQALSCRKDEKLSAQRVAKSYEAHQGLIVHSQHVVLCQILPMTS